MYFRILKKDLRRKKTMNVILLIFIILATMFIASSVQNMRTINSALDDFFERAKLMDYTIITMGEGENNSNIEQFIKENENVKNYGVDEHCFINEKNIRLSDGKSYDSNSTLFLGTAILNQQKFFDENNKEISDLKENEIYMPTSEMYQNGLKKGDTLTLKNADTSIKLKVAGGCKDVLMGSSMMGSKRILVSNSVYNEFRKDAEITKAVLYSVNAKNLEDFVTAYNRQYIGNTLVSCDKKLVRTTYTMDMVVAAALTIVSICLILISILILRFTIVFTLQEEFRQIGIMKAIGLPAGSIRRLYIVKYFAISAVGAALGFVLSIPFGKMLLRQVSQNIVMEQDRNAVWLNFICALLIVAIVILFGYLCTGDVNKCSPIDAIRNGSNGERFKKKGVLRLSKCKRLPGICYMAVNDILSSMKRYGVLMLTFMIGVILLIIPINTINTLNSDSAVKQFAMAESDVYIADEVKSEELVTSKDRHLIENYLKDIKNDLNNHGIDADVFLETYYNFNAAKGEKSASGMHLQGIGDVKASEYTYLSGSAPEDEGEVALSHVTADKINAGIGDTVSIRMGDEEKKFMVTAVYQSMNNLGEGVRFSEKEKIDSKFIQGMFAAQIRFNGQLSGADKQTYFDKVKELYQSKDVYHGGEYISYMIGDVAGQVDSVKQLILIVIIAINMLVTVLMVKTFIAKERGEIGMLKSIGFRNSALVWWQTLRIGIVMVMSVILGTLLSGPASQISSARVFEQMGLSHTEFVVNPIEVYVIYPLILLLSTMLAGFITAQQVRRVSAQETNNIE